MKETEIQHKENIENVRQVEAKAELKFVGIMQPKKGQQIWEYNYVTREIRIAEMEKLPYVVKDPNKKKISIARNPLLGFAINNQPKPVAKVIQKENCTYVKALNIENAVRKLGLAVKIVKKKNKK